MIKNFMIITSIILGLFVAGGMILPSSYTIKRSISISAPIEKIHANIEDLSAWKKWSPWALSDDSMQTNSSKTRGVGATQSWKSDKGDGTLTITKSDVNSGVDYSVFFDHKRYENQAGFTYEKQGSDTIVTWYMNGTIPTPVVGGYVAYLTEMMSSDIFDKGLLNLKVLAEK